MILEKYFFNPHIAPLSLRQRNFIMSLSDSVKSKIDTYVHGNKVVLFMKGTPQQPQCGFSAKTIAALDSVLPDYASVNVLEDAETAPPVLPVKVQFVNDGATPVLNTAPPR